MNVFDWITQGVSRPLLRFVYQKITLVLLFLFCTGILIAVLGIVNLSNSLIESQALQYAQVSADALNQARIHYSTNVVRQVKDLPEVQAIPLYKDIKNAIPNPATFAIELGQLLSDQEKTTNFRLYSDYPFPNRQNSGGVKDKFEQDALDFLQKNPTQTFYRQEKIEDQLVFRYAEAITMEPSCVECHNRLPSSPKRDWKVGDVRGVVSISQPLEQLVLIAQDGIRKTVVSLTGIILLAFLGMLFVFNRLRYLNQKLQDKVQETTTLNTAYERFVPNQFLSFLEKESIVEVELGDQIEQEMTILFSDIRDFTTISEQMNPAQNFDFINEYLGYMEPKIQQHGGFIDKYIGDAIMALFPNRADDGLIGAIAMLEELKKYNKIRQNRNLQPLRIGIGLHTGSLMLGTVGGSSRMDGTAIGDAVNISSRVEGLTKTYGISLLMTHQTFLSLNNPLDYDFRFVDKVKVKGKAQAVSLFEVFSADPRELRDAKIMTKDKFEKAILAYHRGDLQQAIPLFQYCVEIHSGDRAAHQYLQRCHQQILSNYMEARK